MTIKAIDVKKLREITNAGMMDCKKALIESNGDFEQAKTILKEKGQSKADSKSGRTTAQGLVVIQSNEDHAVILEVNCETDFAAKDDLFTEFVDRVASIILQNDLDDMEQLDKQKTDDFDTVEEYRKFAISKLGENITIRRFKRIHLDGILGKYIHGSKIASLVLLDHHDSAELAKDIAMHVAASRPEYISNSDIPEEVIKEESRILRVQVEQEGKPEEIIDKIVDGKIKKQFDQLTLMGQEYVKDPDITVEKFLKDQDASVKSFIRYEVGEGIELDQVNFADEVKAQVDALKLFINLNSKEIKRILLKLSGEALLGDQQFGVDPKVLIYLAKEIKSVTDKGVEVGIVIGAGNIFRGEGLAESGIDRVTGDHMGMLGTIINALAIQDALEREDIVARVMSALKVNEVCEDYIRRRAIRHLEKGRVTIFAAGTGNPYFTTDSAASLRAVEIEADLLVKATRVNGVFSEDPMVNQKAEHFEKISYDDFISKGLKVMDTTSIVMCKENNLPVQVYDISSKNALLQIVQGKNVGTLIE